MVILLSFFFTYRLGVITGLPSQGCCDHYRRGQLKITTEGTSLVVQQLRLCTFNARSVSSISGWGTKIQHTAWGSQKVKKKKKKLPWLLPIFSKFSKINHYFIYYRITIFYIFSSHYSTFFSNLYIYQTYLSKPLSFPCQHFAYRSEKKLSL